MKRIETRVDILASQSQVWDAITDLQNYGAWNPFIRQASGEPVQNRMIDIVMCLAEKGRQKYRVRLTAVRPQQEFRWFGTFKMPGLIDGNHAFLLEYLAAGNTRLHHVEEFSGILVPFVWRGYLLRYLQPAFIALNENLKAYCEGRVLPVELDRQV